ncbi:MAG TPA: hypothetical protein VIU40_12700 [Geobacteraceae bacterium]
MNNSDCNSRYGINKRQFFSMIFPLLMLLAGCSPANMVKKDERFDIKTVRPEQGKAALVVARTTSFGGAINFFTYLDKKSIGVTRGKGCFVKKDIEPSQQYLIARTESLEAGKIKFEPDTVYYVQQTPRMGVMVARVTMTPVTPDHLSEEIGEDGCTYYELDQKDPPEDLTDHEYQEAVTDYEREVTEGYHKDFTEYKGFKVQN